MVLLLFSVAVLQFFFITATRQHFSTLDLMNVFLQMEIFSPIGVEV
jgi:hypothetical protein